MNKQALISYSDILRLSWRYYSRYFWLWMGIMSPVLLATIVFSVAGLFYSFGVYESQIGLALAALDFFLFAFVNVGFIYAAAQVMTNKRVSGREAFRKGVPTFFSYVLVTLTTALALGLLFLIWMAPSAFLFTFSAPGLLIIRIFFGVLAIFFMIPFFLVAVWFFFGPHVAVLEKKGVIGSLARSKELVNRFFGAALFRIFWITLFFLAIVLAVWVLGTIMLSLLFGLSWSGGFVEPEPWWVTILGQGVSLLLWPLFNLGILLLYFSLLAQTQDAE